MGLGDIDMLRLGWDCTAVFSLGAPPFGGCPVAWLDRRCSDFGGSCPSRVDVCTLFYIPCTAIIGKCVNGITDPYGLLAPMRGPAVYSRETSPLPEGEAHFVYTLTVSVTSNKVKVNKVKDQQQHD